MIRTLLTAAIFTATAGAAMAKDPIHVSLAGKDRATYAAEIRAAAVSVCRENFFTVSDQVACQRRLTRTILAEADAIRAAGPGSIVASGGSARR